MRTTLTLDTDVVLLLREAMHRSRRSFKETLNGVLREGLTGSSARVKQKPFLVHARPMGMRAGFDPTGFDKLADDLEIEANVAKRRRAARP